MHRVQRSAEGCRGVRSAGIEINKIIPDTFWDGINFGSFQKLILI